jgi:hypothetical protein
MSNIRWTGHDAATETTGGGRVELADIVCTLLDGAERARLLELHYWSEEPQLLDIIRIVVGLTDETREALRTFLVQASDPQEISATTHPSGQLTLSAPIRSAAILSFRSR